MAKAKKTEGKEVEKPSGEDRAVSEADSELPEEEGTSVSSPPIGVKPSQDSLSLDDKTTNEEEPKEEEKEVPEVKTTKEKIEAETETEETETKEEVKEPEVEEEAETKEKEIPAGLAIETPTSSRLSKLVNKKNILVALVVVSFLGVIGGGIFVYKKTIGEKEVSPSSEVAPLAGEDSSDGGTTEAVESGEELPTPSSTPELKREKLKIQVLNGTGAPGIAGEAKEFLEGLGYKEIEVGNADAYDYKETEVSIKEDKKDYLEMLTGDLSETYSLSDETKTLSEDSEFDAVVTVGKK